MKIVVRYVLSMIFAELICVAIFLLIAENSVITRTESKKILYEFAPSLLLGSRRPPTAAYQFVLISRLDSIVRTSSYYLLLSPIAAAVINFACDLRTRFRLRNSFAGVLKADQSSLEDKTDEPILSDEHTVAILAVCVFVTSAFGQYISSGEGFVSSFFSIVSVLWLIAHALVTLSFLSAVILLLARLFSPKFPAKVRWRYTIALVPLFLPIAVDLWSWHYDSMFMDGFGHPEVRSRDGDEVFQNLFWAFLPVSALTIYLCRGYRVFCAGIVLGEFVIWLDYGLHAVCGISNFHL